MSHRLLKHAKAPEAMMTASLPQTCLVLDASGARRLNLKGLLQCRCQRDMQNGGVAACGFTFDPSDYNRAAVTNMDGRPKLNFFSCR